MASAADAGDAPPSRNSKDDCDEGAQNTAVLDRKIDATLSTAERESQGADVLCPQPTCASSDIVVSSTGTASVDAASPPFDWASFDGLIGATEDALASRLISACNRRESECDYQLCMAAAALRSFKHDSLLRPFPKHFLTESGDKDYDRMRLAMDAVPLSVQSIANGLEKDMLDAGVCGLLDWALYPRNFRLRRVDTKETFAKLQRATGPSSYPVTPDYVFAVIYPERTEEPFKRMAAEYGTQCGYHGSPFENFYSIVSNGLASHMNKTSLYGEGTYLSKDLSVSYNFSQAQRGWEGSALGASLACVCACDVIDHPDIVAAEKGKIRQVESESGEPIPAKYYLVRNNSHIRVRYVLVFVSSGPSPLRTSTPTRGSRWSAASHWMRQHLFYLILIVYGLILVYAGGGYKFNFLRRLTSLFWPPQVRRT
eukprot:Opistho-2@26225